MLARTIPAVATTCEIAKEQNELYHNEQNVPDHGRRAGDVRYRTVGGAGPGNVGPTWQKSWIAAQCGHEGRFTMR
jgi:hypothetical protein